MSEWNLGKWDNDTDGALNNVSIYYKGSVSSFRVLSHVPGPT